MGLRWWTGRRRALALLSAVVLALSACTADASPASNAPTDNDPSPGPLIALGMPPACDALPSIDRPAGILTSEGDGRGPDETTPQWVWQLEQQWLRFDAQRSRTWIQPGWTSSGEADVPLVHPLVGALETNRALVARRLEAVDGIQVGILLEKSAIAIGADARRPALRDLLDSPPINGRICFSPDGLRTGPYLIAQRHVGDAWELLAHSGQSRESFRTGLATTPAEFANLWARLGSPLRPGWSDLR